MTVSRDLLNHKKSGRGTTDSRNGMSQF